MVTRNAPIPKKGLIFAASLAAFLLVLGATYYVYSSRSAPSKLSQAFNLKKLFEGAANTPPTSTLASRATQVTLTVSQTPTPTVVDDGTNDTYKSDNVSFKVKKSQGAYSVGVKIEGNKAFIGGVDASGNGGIFLEEFKKDSNDSLIEAITKQFMKEGVK